MFAFTKLLIAFVQYGKYKWVSLSLICNHRLDSAH